jgi:NAD(P)-dependent dehydrogenase (short-subunit alcohol dehydrogenase family)
MPDRAAIVTGASSGIGLALTRMLCEEGHAVTMAARRPDKLQAAYDGLKGEGLNVEQFAGNLGDEDTIKQVVAQHEQSFGRLDVLCNNAGVGVGAAVAEMETKRIDLQLNTNIRSIFLFYREAIGLLRKAGEEHRNALVVNTSSISGKRGEAWLSVYSATKHAVVGFTQAMNKELANDGVKNCALCPGFVDTPMTEFVKGQVPADTMIRPEDIAEGVRMLLKLSPGCVVPEILFEQPGGGPLAGI